MDKYPFIVTVFRNADAARGRPLVQQHSYDDIAAALAKLGEHANDRTAFRATLSVVLKVQRGGAVIP